MVERVRANGLRGENQPPATADDLADLDAKVNAILPPRYQHCYSDVGPASMGSAKLSYGPDGRVAWDQIWTTFCDLALAGGPPHRGTLLEPVDPAAVVADPEGAARVAAEIVRAVRLVSALPADPRAAPGWVGVECWSEAMAAWLACAVVAENVSARRAGKVLHLPAGPGFRIEKEVKNVVTALAKTAHYWDGHLTNHQQSAADALRDPIFPADDQAASEGRHRLAADVESGVRAACGCRPCLTPLIRRASTDSVFPPHPLPTLFPGSENRVRHT